MNAISRRSLLARGGLLLAASTAAANTPVHALAAAGPDGMIYEGTIVVKLYGTFERRFYDGLA